MSTSSANHLVELQEVAPIPAARSRSVRHSLLSVVTLLISVWVTRPFVEMGVDDDFSYTRTAQLMAQTGHFVYNGWAAAMLGWQVLLGALFIKLFGFSFTVVRMSTVLVALATTYLLHRLLLRLGLNLWNATIGTLMIVLSPIFFPLVPTFMSDVGGFFAIVVCLYCCVRAVLAAHDRASLAWLCTAALSNVGLGTVRQISWLGVLVMVPATAWLLRKRRGHLAVGVVLWIVGVMSVLGCMHWFLQQPYSVPEPIIDGKLDLLIVQRVVQHLVKIPMTLALFSLPLLAAFSWASPGARAARIPRWVHITVGSLVALFVMAAVLLLASHHFLENLLLPWPRDSNVFSVEGILSVNQLPGQHAILLALPECIALTLIVFYGLANLAAICFARLRVPGMREKGARLSYADLNLLLLPFLFCYLGLLMPRAVFHNFIFDRYMTAPLLVITIYLMRYYQERFAARLPWITVAGVALFAVFSIAGTRDLFSLNQARLKAVNEIEQDDVPRQQIEGGFEYDGWTQIVSWGYLNEVKLINPPGAYHPPPPMPFDPCRYYFLRYTPAVQPRFVLAYDEDCYQPSAYAAVPVPTWLPPYTQKVFVRQLEGR